jgi:hypothetical protein
MPTWCASSEIRTRGAHALYQVPVADLGEHAFAEWAPAAGARGDAEVDSGDERDTRWNRRPPGGSAAGRDES